MDTLYSNDHDILIAVSTKVDQLKVDIRDLSDGLANRVSKIESRLDLMDIYHAGIPLKDYEEIAKWTENFRANIKLLVSVGVVGAGVFATLFQLILKTYLKF